MDNGNEARIVAIEEGLTHLIKLVETNITNQQQVNTDLYTKFDSNSKTNWGVIWSALGVLLAMLVAMGTAFYKPLESQQRIFEKQIEKSANKYDELLQLRREDFELLIRHDERLKRVEDERYLNGLGK